MTRSPEISVIVPIYNVSAYLPACLDSILQQDFDSYEIIAVDDGSTDQSGKIADEYAQRFPEKIRVIHQRNQGLGGARNTGIENASGEYLIFVDSDDTIEKGMLAGLWKIIVHTSAQIIIYGMKIVNENGEELEAVIEPQKKQSLLNFREEKDILFCSPIACNKVFCKSLFFDTGIRFPPKVWYEDIRTITKLYLVSDSILVLDDCYYKYLRRNSSIMQNKNASNIERNLEILDAFDDIIDYYKSQDAFGDFYNELEYLAIQHVFIAASVRVIRTKLRKDLLQMIREYMLKNFCSFNKNSYIKMLNLNKKIIFYLLKFKLYRLVHFVFILKEKMGC